MKRLAAQARIFLVFLAIILVSFTTGKAFSQTGRTQLNYTISIDQPESFCYDLEFHISNWEADTICLKLPNWMPGYYQMMDYAKDLENFSVKDEEGNSLAAERVKENTWIIHEVRDKSIVVYYRIKTTRKFVANSYVDADHAYLVPGNSFLYVDGLLDAPARVKLLLNPEWQIATGLEAVRSTSNEFMAPDFDILYDCPILIGELEELPSFEVKGIEHRFIGYKLGSFDRSLFMDKLKRTVRTATDLMGEIPYKQYTFIGIGPGMGGIEHLNNTTVSFDGKRLNSPEGMDRMMSFLAHEYFHHYNVKRIRPLELGPFDYDQGSRTHLLWISEGITVYYESLILLRAGLIDAKTFISQQEAELTTLENDPGRLHQSLSQASYSTWEDGPFGGRGEGPDKSISVYNKGAVVGMLLDLEIRGATKNTRSLDDVMRSLYRKYYKEEQRGFTDAEFQHLCEQIAGKSLTDLFEYVYTTKEIDYDTHLSRAGLGISKQSDTSNGNRQILNIDRLPDPDSQQSAILSSWLGE